MIYSNKKRKFNYYFCVSVERDNVLMHATAAAQQQQQKVFN